MDKQSYQKLVSASKKGDRNAYCQLIAPHYKRIYLMSLGTVGDSETAKHIARDAFIKGYESINKLSKPTDFPGWIGKIAQAICTLESDTTTTENAPQVIEKTHKLLYNAIMKLSPPHRMMLIMYYFDKQDVAHIAQTLALEPSSIYQKLQLATTQLHTSMTGPGKNQMARPCEKMHNRIIAMMLGTSNQLDARAVRDHMNRCDNCRQFYHATQQQHVDLLDLGRQLDPNIRTQAKETLNALHHLPKDIAPKKNLPLLKIISPIIAAAIIIIVGLLIWPDGSTPKPSWHQIVDQYSGATYLHRRTEAILKSGTKLIDDTWLKRPGSLRAKFKDKIYIDDGTKKLTLDKNTKLAKQSDSEINKPAPNQKFEFASLIIFSAANSRKFKPQIIDPDENGRLAYKLSNDEIEGYDVTVLVNPKTLLPEEIHWQTTAAVKPQTPASGTTYLSYEPLKDSLFSTKIPDGYNLPDEPKTQYVFDEQSALEAKLNKLDDMFENGNIAALIKSLQSKYLQVSTTAADYIAQIGDLSAMEPLLKASPKWQGSSDTNPYIAAIKTILQRTRPIEEPKEEIPEVIPEVEVIEEVEEIEIPEEPIIPEMPPEPNSIVPAIADPNTSDPNVLVETLDF